MESDYVIVSTKLCPEVGNDEYIVLCNFGAIVCTVLKLWRGASKLKPPFPGRRKRNKARLNKVKIFLLIRTASLPLRDKDEEKYDNRLILLILIIPNGKLPVGM